MSELNINRLSTATIRQIVAIAEKARQKADEDFIHLEVGNPGLPANSIGVKAEIEALEQGVANSYPPLMGLDSLKQAASDFIKAFLNIDIPGKCIIPTVGSMQGSFTTMLLLSKRNPGKDTMLYLDPGFAPQHLQAGLVGMKQESFDIYNYRGDALAAKLEEILKNGNITGILYSNPNNPAWTNLTEHELKAIGTLATKYDAIVVEDLAYMGMDFRSDCGQPHCEPYILSVANYTDNYVLLISGSKIFSYAGQRIALAAFSPHIFNSTDEGLSVNFGLPTYGEAYIFGIIYAVSSGVSHSAQHAMAEMMRAATEGRLNFVNDCREYEKRCARARKIFIDNGFELVYDTDSGKPVSDGFFFTVTYGDIDSETLQQGLMRHGVATIALPGTGSTREGLRICVSRLADEADFETLDKRLKAFVDEQ